MKKLLLSVLSAAALCGCATSAVVFVSNNYRPDAIKRVSIAKFSDCAGHRGSGEASASTFEKYLIGTQYTLVERRQASQIMDEHKLNTSGAVEQSTAKELGKLLGVDALVFGTVTSYTDVRQQTVMTQVLQVQNEPIFSGGGVHGRPGVPPQPASAQRLVASYVPETQTLPASVGLSVRLVDVESGEVLWNASATGTGESLSAAEEDASSAIMKNVTSRLKKLAGK